MALIKLFNRLNMLVMAAGLVKNAGLPVAVETEEE
jgi:hypothetical protein